MIDEALRLIRVFHDFNQTEMALKLGISNSYLSEIETGKKPVTIDFLKKYSSILNVPISSLLFFSESLESNQFPEKTKIFLSEKILQIMQWISAKGLAHSEENPK
ncbi:MAG: helix-turn-helix transcriptional regulator [Proteobacteria bacterium]|nr:helix-turn-helix transcriptional regulator [Pseudomonadota bacterium]